MNLNHYIILSVVTHLLLFGMLAMIPPLQDAAVPVFDVGIISLPEEPQVETGKIEQPPVPKPERPARPFRRPDPPAKKLPPERIDGDSGSNIRQKEDEGVSSIDGGRTDHAGRPPAEDAGVTPLAPRNFLFDRETIERFAEKPGPENRSFTFDVEGFRHRGYMRMLQQKIESIWEYPREMASRGISGDLYIQFLIRRDGSLGEVSLLRTSGHRELDEAAIMALRKAEPFWPLPDDWEKEGLEIKGHFIYLLGSTLIL